MRGDRLQGILVPLLCLFTSPSLAPPHSFIYPVAVLLRLSDIPVLYEDDDILALNKPAGISVVPERYEEGEASLLELLSQRALGRRSVQAPGEDGAVDVVEGPLGVIEAAPAGPGPRPVHRIDKETSGVLLFAQTNEAFRALSLQFQERALTKVYRALVSGRPFWTETLCDEPLLPDGDRKHRTIVSREGKPSRTHFRVLETFRGFTLLEARPETGRTHQIRAHLSCLGHPIVGDALYGGGGLSLSSFKRGYKGPEKPLLGRLALHALSLELRHPRTGEPLRFEAPYPKDFSVALKQLGKYGK